MRTYCLLAIALLCILGAPVWAQVPTHHATPPPAELRVLVNQVGYDSDAPKVFLVQSPDALPERFTVERLDGRVVHRGVLHAAGRVSSYSQPGADGVVAPPVDWGFQYARGEFNAVKAQREPLRIRVELAGRTYHSPPFNVGGALLWEKTAEPAVAFFYYQRCGMAIPGVHGACHLDDARGASGAQYALAGGWHDAGDYNKYHNAPYVLALANAWGAVEADWRALDTAPGRPGLWDEVLWGGEHALRMLAPDGSAYGEITSGYRYWGAPEDETDNLPGTGDERPIRGAETGHDASMHAAALARIAALMKPGVDAGSVAPAEHQRWIDAADRALVHTMRYGLLRGPLQFHASLDLYIATDTYRYLAQAQALRPEPSADPLMVAATARYDRCAAADHSAQLRDALTRSADEMLTHAENLFGVWTFGDAARPSFFNSPAAGADPAAWHVGTSSDVLSKAHVAALAFAYTGETKYRDFAYAQFNWILGLNPYGLCLMEGVGDVHAPTYHHRYVDGGVPRGAVPGGIVNGITWRAPGDDRPQFDISTSRRPWYYSNEVWLPHNTNYLGALCALRGVKP